MQPLAKAFTVSAPRYVRSQNSVVQTLATVFIISALNMSGVKIGADSGRSNSGETTNRGPLRVYTHAGRSHTHVKDHVVQDCGNRQSCSPGLWKQTILWSRIVETNNPVVQDCGNEQSCSPGLWKQTIL